MIIFAVLLTIGLALRNVLRFGNPLVFAPSNRARAELTELFDSAGQRHGRYTHWLWNLREAEHETRWPEMKRRLNGVRAADGVWPVTRADGMPYWSEVEPAPGNEYWGTVRPPMPHLRRIDVV